MKKHGNKQSVRARVARHLRIGGCWDWRSDRDVGGFGRIAVRRPAPRKPEGTCSGPPWVVVVANRLGN